jgi:(p)ppGpp synthase/HD superfamily hydrolase
MRCRWSRDFFDLDVTLEVIDLKHLNGIMDSLRGKTAVSDVNRKTG